MEGATVTLTIGPPLSTLIAAAGCCGLGVAAGMAAKAVAREIQLLQTRDRQRVSLREYLQEARG